MGIEWLEKRWHGVGAVTADRLRAAWLRLRGARLGPKCRVGRSCIVLRPWCVSTGSRVQIEHGVHVKIVDDGASLAIGHESFVGFGAELDVALEIVIGDHVLVAPGCFITDHSHRHTGTGLIDTQGRHCEPVRIGNDAWLGANAVVLAGVTVGEGAIVGAGAVVSRNVPAYAIVAGVPARVIGERPRPK
jgi:acetyltransferase-like isoleucine patch superfamily enzyme